MEPTHAIHGMVQDGLIVPLDPIPVDWADGRRVRIQADGETTVDDRAEIERWYAALTALGPAQYEPGEREVIERHMLEADRNAKESMKRSWARFDGALPSRHEPPERGAE